jgi:hypothetical protein
LLMQVVANQLALQWRADELLHADALRCVPYSEHSVLAARHLLAHCRTQHTYDTLQPYLRRCQTVMRAHAELLSAYRPRRLEGPVTAVLFRNTLGLIGQNTAAPVGIAAGATRHHRYRRGAFPDRRTSDHGRDRSRFNALPGSRHAPGIRNAICLTVDPWQ